MFLIFLYFCCKEASNFFFPSTDCNLFLQGHSTTLSHCQRVKEDVHREGIKGLKCVRLHNIGAAHGFIQEMHNGNGSQFPKSLEVGEVSTPRPGQMRRFISTTHGASFWNELNFVPVSKHRLGAGGLKRSRGLCLAIIRRF